MKSVLADHRAHSISFDGALLNRGFWLYVWRIKCGPRTVFYVGRTGDTSSENAASPFNRLSQHLNLRKNSKGNALARNLNKEGLKPEECRFEFIALGPLIAESDDVGIHRARRDAMAAVETFAADWLRNCKNEKVLGNHPKPRECDVELKQVVEKFLAANFP